MWGDQKRESLYPKCLYYCTACTKNHRQKGINFVKRRSKILRIRAEKQKENKKQTAYNVIINAYRHSSALHAWVDMQAKEEANRHKRSARKKLLKYETKINSSFHVFMCALHTSVHSFHEFSRTSKIKSFSSSYSLLLLLMLTIYLLMCLSTYFSCLTSCLLRRCRLLSTTAKPCSFYLMSSLFNRLSKNKKYEKIRKKKLKLYKV